QRITSSLKRDKCTAINASAERTSTAKSRSLTASIEFCVIDENSSSFAIKRNGRPATRARAERQDVEALARVRHAPEIALEHFDVCEEMMRKEYRLCALKMRVAGDDDFSIAISEVHERPLQIE